MLSAALVHPLRPGKGADFDAFNTQERRERLAAELEPGGRVTKAAVVAMLAAVVKKGDKSRGSMVKVPSLAGQSLPSQPPHMEVCGSRLLHDLSHAATPLALGGRGAVARPSQSRPF